MARSVRRRRIVPRENSEGEKVDTFRQKKERRVGEVTPFKNFQC